MAKKPSFKNPNLISDTKLDKADEAFINAAGSNEEDSEGKPKKKKQPRIRIHVTVPQSFKEELEEFCTEFESEGSMSQVLVRSAQTYMKRYRQRQEEG